MSTKVKLLLVFCSVFVAAIAVGSNMGFKLNYTLLTNTDGNNVNWIAIPYFDNYTTAENVCDDIGGDSAGDCAAGTATSLGTFDTANNADITHSCGSTKSDFAIVAGKSYKVSVSVAGCTYKIVGSHDDSYDSANGVSFVTNADSNNLNWIAVPYHTTAANAEAICTQINTGCSNIVSSLGYYDTANNADVTHSCGSSKSNFTIVPGTGLKASVTAAGTSCWHPAHY
jgi:hypothetical protein